MSALTSSVVNLGSNFKNLLNDFDLICESASESMYDSATRAALLQAIETENPDDLLSYAKIQVSKVKEYIQKKAELQQ